MIDRYVVTGSLILVLIFNYRGHTETSHSHKITQLEGDIGSLLAEGTLS